MKNLLKSISLNLVPSLFANSSVASRLLDWSMVREADKSVSPDDTGRCSKQADPVFTSLPQCSLELNRSSNGT
jgi:hypothetical protein